MKNNRFTFKDNRFTWQNILIVWGTMTGVVVVYTIIALLLSFFIADIERVVILAFFITLPGLVYTYFQLNKKTTSNIEELVKTLGGSEKNLLFSPTAIGTMVGAIATIVAIIISISSKNIPELPDVSQVYAVPNTNDTEIQTSSAAISPLTGVESAVQIQEPGVVEIYTTLMEEDPSNVALYIARGNAYANLGRYQEAVRDFTTALERSPYIAPLYIRRGIASAAMNNYDSSGEDFTKADELLMMISTSRTPLHTILPIGVQVSNGSSESYLSFKSYISKEIENFTTVIEQSAGDSSLYVYRAFLYELIGEGVDAVADYQKFSVKEDSFLHIDSQVRLERFARERVMAIDR